MTTKKETTKKIKKVKLKALEVEDNSIIVSVNGWRKRAYFDLDKKTLTNIRKNKKNFKGKVITIEYIGELKDIKTVKFNPLKSL